VAVLNNPIQLTHCVQAAEVASNPHARKFLHILAGASMSAGLAALITAVTGGGGLLAAAAAIFFAPFGGIVGYCDWFFNHRLVCIGKQDVTAIGTVIQMDVGFDGDDTLNLLLAPAGAGLTLDQLRQTSAQAALLMRDNFSAQFPALGFAPGSTPDIVTPLLTTEVEGTRMLAFCAGASIGTLIGGGLGAAAFGACVQQLGGSFLAVLGCFLLAVALFGLVAALGALAGYALGGTASTQDPESWSNTVEAGDCVAMCGRFVYDPEYDGWNEIHAVMRIMKLWPGNCPGLTEDQYKKISQALTETESPAVRRSELTQGRNRFLVHPSIG
jgi:hypothetical protein